MATPKLRFSEFKDEWRQYVLSDVLSLLKDGTHGSHIDVKDGVYLLSAKNIKNSCIVFDSSDRQISTKEYEKIHSNFKLINGDVLMTIVGTIGEAAILENSNNITFQRSVAFLRPNDKILNTFLLQTIYSETFQKELNNRKSIGAQPGIYLGDVAQIPIMIPSELDEQYKISSFLSLFDNLISFNEEKLNELQNLKKSLLQKMFPKSDETVPEIRFPGFDEDWEEDFLSNCCSITTGNSNAEDAIENGKYRFFDRSIDDVKYIDSYFLDKKAIIYAGEGSEFLPRYYEGKFALHQRCYALYDFHKKIDSEYLYAFLKTKNKHFLHYAVGSTVPSLRMDCFDFCKILYPKSLEEQQKIGSLFKELDNRIELQKQKIGEIKEYKKGLLQQMFC